MSIFSNKVLNRLNLHYGLRAIGWEMCSLFTLAYLYKQGLSLPLTFAVYAVLTLLRTVSRPFAMRLCLKKSVLFTLRTGTVIFACRYPALYCVQGLSWTIIPFVFIVGFAESFYWTSYHNYFANIGDEETRGASVGFREAMSTTIAVIAPLIGGALLNYNYALAFSLPFVLTFVSLIPLMKMPEIKKPVCLTRKEQKSVDKFGFFVFLGDGFFYQAGVVWSLIVFFILHESYASSGVLLAIAAFFRATGSILFGKLIDKGKGLLVCVIGYGLHLFVFGAKGLVADSVPTIIACDFFAAIAYCFSMTGLMSALYNAMKKEKNSLYFTFYSELGWDIGATSAMIGCGIITYLGFDLRWSMAIAAFGGLLTLFVLRQYYAKKKG